MSFINQALSVQDNLVNLKNQQLALQTAISQLETLLGGAVEIPAAPVVESPVKRGRGRPKGSKNKGTVATTTVATAAVKRSKAWTPEMKAQAARRMRRYWRQRNAGK